MITRALAAFPKVTGPESDWLEWVVGAWSKPGRKGFYGHVDVWLLDGGAWFRGTSRMATGATYTDLDSRGNILTYDPAVWDYLALPLDMPFEAMKQFIVKEAQNSNGYDWLGIANWLCGLIPASRSKYYCSEIVAAMLSFYTPFAFFNINGQNDYRWTPNGVWTSLVDYGCKPPADLLALTNTERAALRAVNKYQLGQRVVGPAKRGRPGPLV